MITHYNIPPPGQMECKEMETIEKRRRKWNQEKWVYEGRELSLTVLKLARVGCWKLLVLT